MLLTLVGAAFMTATGALCKNMEMSNAIGVTIVVLFMLFDGNWINLKNVPVCVRLLLLLLRLRLRLLLLLRRRTILLFRLYYCSMTANALPLPLLRTADHETLTAPVPKGTTAGSRTSRRSATRSRRSP